MVPANYFQAVQQKHYHKQSKYSNILIQNTGSGYMGDHCTILQFS